MTGNIVQAEIIELSCGKRDFIKLRIYGKEVTKRIYLSASECDETKIEIDLENNFVFADDNYNDWSEAESIAIIMLAIFFVLRH